MSEAATTTDRTVILTRQGGTTHRAAYAGAGSTRGTIVLIRWGTMHTLYRFNSKTGIGKGQARAWTIAPESLAKVQAWLKEDENNLKEKRLNA